MSAVADLTRPYFRKRLGQVFTGDPLAGLLAALAHAHQSSTIIDPMAGTGDMLATSRRLAPDALLAGIDIDPAVLDVCGRRLGPEALLVRGSAFDLASWESLPAAWDLVITNPPYVRYQAGRHALSTPPLTVPSAEQVRRALIAQLGTLKHLTDSERDTLLRCAAGYSGLADLAVPSWLLCAARVILGGRLAMVVADTWLNRDYAAPVIYVLRRMFEIEHVVEDGDATWFPDVEVRTTLMVARRVPDKGSALGEGSHLRSVIRRAAASSTSLVGSAIASADPEASFTQWLDEVPEGRASLPGITTKRSDEGDLRAALRSASVRLAWLAGDTPAQVDVAVPEIVRREMDSPPLVVDLAGIGWTVGQGLRTGANDFFYVQKRAGGWISPLLPGEVLSLPGEVLRPAVRNQSELSRGQRVTRRPISAVLVLEGLALPEDAAISASHLRPMGEDLARLVRAAAAHQYWRGSGMVRLPELTAVRPNERVDRRTGRPTKFWYHLPPLAARHVPRLFLPRVCGGRPVPFANPGGELVIDANFSTFWPSDASGLDERALLALLSSTWTWACLEASGTVLGGGALKVEATQLRRLALPVVDGDAVVQLSGLGSQLMTGADVHSKIDTVLNEALALTARSHDRLSTLARHTLDRRLGN